MCFDYAVKLLDNIKLFDLFSKFLYTLDGQRIDNAELQYIYAVSEYFLDVLIRRTRRDNTDLIGLCIFFTVEVLAGISKFRKCLCSFLNDRMTLLCVSRHHYVFRRLLFIFYRLLDLSVGDFDNALCVRDSHKRTEQHDRIEFFRKLERSFCEFKCLRRIRRLKHRNLCGYRVVS